MSLSNKELLGKIKDEVARDNGHVDWKRLYLLEGYPTIVQLFETVIIERYASEKAKGLFTRSEVESCIKDSLEAAAENARTAGTHPVTIDKSSITDTKNIKIK